MALRGRTARGLRALPVSTGTLAEARIARIERVCSRLVLRSIRAFDERDWDGYARLFTPDGVFIRATDPQAPLVGRAAIRAALAARPRTRLTRHLCTNIEIEVRDRDHAEGRCYLLLYGGDSSHPHSPEGRPAEPEQRVGEYRDQYVRTREGWLIGQRAGTLVLYARSDRTGLAR